MRHNPATPASFAAAAVVPAVLPRPSPSGSPASPATIYPVLSPAIPPWSSGWRNPVRREPSSAAPSESLPLLPRSTTALLPALVLLPPEPLTGGANRPRPPSIAYDAGRSALGTALWSAPVGETEN